MKVIRASEIGSYLFCARAWWYQQQGIESSNQGEMNTGTELHHRHGRAVMVFRMVRTLAFIVFLAALVLLVSFCTAKLF